MKVNMLKWKLMLTTLPITMVVLAIKMGVVYGLGYDGVVKFSEISIVITGGIFLIGFMLAGTVSDYKESEKIPAEMASALETLEDSLFFANGLKGGFDFDQMRMKLNEVTESILNFLKMGGSEEVVYQKISRITDIAITLEKAGVGGIATRMTNEQHSLRKLFSRLNVIRKTNFLATGYALLEVLIVVILSLLMVAKFDSAIVMVIIVSFITQIFIYMLRLIRDVDQPFEYSPTGRAQAADVDLFPLADFHKRSSHR